MTIVAGSTQGFAQKRTGSPKAGEELRERVLVAFTKSKRIAIKVSDPGDLSGAGIKDGEVTGFVKSVNGNCFRLEYKDGVKQVRSDCIPYSDAAIVKWHTKALHVLRVIGEDSAIGAAGVILMPIVILVFATAALVGHPISGC
jgi:hypothetical protein